MAEAVSTRIPYTCPACGERGHAPVQYAGKVTPCPDCDKPMRIGPPPAPNGTPPLRTSLAAPPPKADPAAKSTEVKVSPRFRANVVIGTCVLIWIGTLHSEPSWAVLFHYIAIVVAFQAVGYLLSKRLASTWPIGASVALGVAAACVWYQFDVYHVHWTNVDDAGAEMTFSDWHDRSTGDVYFRRASKKMEGGRLSASGPFAGTGKPHGHWTYSLPGDWLDSHDLWYWYGEEVTEGEWHLRNR